MKKITSLLIVFILVFSIFVFASCDEADDYVTLEDGTGVASTQETFLAKDADTGLEIESSDEGVYSSDSESSNNSNETTAETTAIYTSPAIVYSETTTQETTTIPETTTVYTQPETTYATTPPETTTYETTTQAPDSSIVYVTNSGKKYHRDGCQYLKKSKIAISLSDAQAQDYTPCSKCF